MADYEVGYGRPPKHTRFQKGRSGNPGGRPPKSQTMAATLERVLSQKISVRNDGQTKRVSGLEAICMSLMAKGLQGNMQAMRLLLGLAERTKGLENVSELTDAGREGAAAEITRILKILRSDDSRT